MGKAAGAMGVMACLALLWLMTSSLISSVGSAWFNFQPKNQGPSKEYPIPPRPSAAHPEQLDLTLAYNAFLKPGWDPATPGDDLGDLTAGLHEIAGIVFDARGVVRSNPSGGTQGHEIESREIPVGRPVRRFHFLHAAHGSPKWAKGRIGAYRVLYQDGQIWEIPLVINVNLRDWREPLTVGKDPLLPAAWHGTNLLSSGRSAELFTSTWTNPMPSTLIKSIRLVGSPAAASAIVAAITVERPAEGTRP